MRRDPFLRIRGRHFPFLLVTIQPLTCLFAILACSMHPQVGVWMNHLTLRNREDLGDRRSQECDLRQFRVIAQKFGPYPTCQHRSAFQA